MAKLIWSRNMTRDRLHESEDKRKDLIDFYDYDELLETLDDDQVDDLIDSDERMPAMDNAYYDEDVRPKIEAQTLDGIVLLVERPEEDGEEPKEEPEEEPEVEGSLNEEDEEEEEEVPEVDDELPELEGLAILADEIPEEFSDAKIVDDGDGFVLEDGDTKYDMYAIPEDKVEEFMDKCMDDPMEDVMDEDEEFESDIELDVDSINDNCDFSMVPEVCERIVGEPEEESEEEPEEDEEELEEASAKPSDVDQILKEVEELKGLFEKYGLEYFTSMSFSDMDKDPTTFEDQFPRVGKIWRDFFREVLDTTDDEEINEIWKTDIDQADWDTVIEGAERLANKVNKKGAPSKVMLTQVFASKANKKYKDPADNGDDELVDDDYSESLDEDAELPFGPEAQDFIKSCVDEMLKTFKENGQEELTDDLLKDPWDPEFSLEDCWVEKNEMEDLLPDYWDNEDLHDAVCEFGLDYLKSKLGKNADESLDEAMTITEAPYQDEYGYIDDDAEGITPDEAKEDIDDFLDGEITIEAFRDFDNDDRELGKEEWIRQMIEFNFDADDLIQDWYENYNANSVEKIEDKARDYFNDKATALLSQVWDHYAGVKEDLIVDSEPSEESVDPDDNLTEEWVIYNNINGDTSYGKVIDKNNNSYTVLPENNRITRIGASSIRESFRSKDALLDSYDTNFDEVDNKVEERRNKVHNAYYNKMRAQDEEFDEYNTPIDEEVLNKVSREYGYDVGRLRDELKNKKPLEEDEGDAVEKTADAVGAEEVIKPTESKGEIYKALDKSLKTAKTKRAIIAK